MCGGSAYAHPGQVLTFVLCASFWDPGRYAPLRKVFLVVYGPSMLQYFLKNILLHIKNSGLVIGHDWLSGFRLADLEVSVDKHLFGTNN